MKYSLWGLALALCVLLTAAFVAGCSGQPTEQPTPTASGGSQPTGGFVAISSGTLHTCGLREDGSAACWGSEIWGEASPLERKTFTAISSGDTHTCGLREDGSVACWGDNSEGQSSPTQLDSNREESLTILKSSVYIGTTHRKVRSSVRFGPLFRTHMDGRWYWPVGVVRRCPW